MFAGAPPQLKVTFESKGIFHEGVVEEWDPHLQCVHHTHAIDLCQHVSRQQAFHVHVKHQVYGILFEAVFFGLEKASNLAKMAILV